MLPTPKSLSGTSIPEMNLPWVESPFFRELLPGKCRSRQEREDAAFYHENGYLVFRGAVTAELADRVRMETRDLFRPGVREGPRCANRVYAGWRESAAVRELAGHPRVLAALRFLYGREAIPFHTVDFLYGSQRRAHCDSIHYGSMPSRFLCAAWVALEDISPEAGPLFFYPGSHQAPEYNFYDLGLSVGNLDYRRYEDFLESLMSARGFRREVLLARKGDVMIYSSNLVHGGGKILRSGSTRWSQITHYAFRNCLCYTPLHSNFLTGELQHHEIRDVTTGAFVEQTYNGKPFSAMPTGWGQYRISERFPFLGKLVAGARHAFYSLRGKVLLQPYGYRE